MARRARPIPLNYPRTLRNPGPTPPLAAQETLRHPRFLAPVVYLSIFFRLGFLDGFPGLIYCRFQGIQFFHIKAKIYELPPEGLTPAHVRDQRAWPIAEANRSWRA